MTSNLCCIIYNNYAIIGEYILGQDRYNLIEQFDPDSSEEYIKEWFPNGMKPQQYIDMRTTIRYAPGGIVNNPHTRGWTK